MNTKTRDKLRKEMIDISKRISQYQVVGLSTKELIERLSGIEINYWDMNPHEDEFAEDMGDVVITARFFHYAVNHPLESR